MFQQTTPNAKASDLPKFTRAQILQRLQDMVEPMGFNHPADQKVVANAKTSMGYGASGAWFFSPAQIVRGLSYDFGKNETISVGLRAELADLESRLPVESLPTEVIAVLQKQLSKLKQKYPIAD